MAKFVSREPSSKSTCWISTEGDFFECEADQRLFCETNRVFCEAFCRASNFNLL
jgi:hypothetical protein